MQKDKPILPPAHMASIGSLGGKVTLARHGTNYFSQLARKRWERRKRKAVVKARFT